MDIETRVHPRIHVNWPPNVKAREGSVTGLDPEEIKRVKVHPAKSPRCRLTVMVKPSEKVCPVCGDVLSTSAANGSE